MSSRVQQLQIDALDPSVPVSDLLRKAKVVASKLGLTEFEAWIDKEMRGYGPDDELPRYRHAHGEPVALNPYHGWQAIIFKSAKQHESAGKVEIGSTVGELDDLARRGGSGELFVSYPPEAKSALIKGLNWTPHDVSVRFDRTVVVGILNAVRDGVLEWSLKLEREGILGEGLSFSAQEKAKAREVASTVTIHIQNIENFAGNVGGSISGQSSVTATQTSVSAPLDLDKLRQVLAQIRLHVDSLPPDLLKPVSATLADVEAEANSEKPDESKIKAGLRSIWRMVEGAASGAAGNLIASGILSQLAPFLSGG